MARKGEIGRENVKKAIIDAFGDNFVGEQDKKLYVWANDGGEQVQFAISITMPKNPLGDVPKNPNDWSEPIDNGSVAGAVKESSTVTISAEDEAKVQELMKTLNII